MGKIKILKGNDIYKVGEVIEVVDLIRDYCSGCSDKDMIDWLWRVPIPTAVKFIADAWGIEYEYV